MEGSSLLNTISDNIIQNVKKYAGNTFKTCWINTGTDLCMDLKMGDLQIIDLLLQLEKQYNITLNKVPISKSSFKISYLAKLLELSYMNNMPKESDLVSYAMRNVEQYRQIQDKEVEKMVDINWEEDFHIGSTEFNSIADRYYPIFFYGDLIYRRSVGADGKFTFSLKTPIEEIFSNLQIWRKRGDWYNISPRDRVANFVSSNYVGNRLAYPESTSVLKSKGIEMEICESLMTPLTIKDSLQQLKRFSPKWLRGNCSSIYNLCMSILKHEIYLEEVTYIEIVSNNFISENIMELIADVFKNAQISISILNPHVGAFLLTCPEQHLHQISDSTLINISKESNQYTDILLSDWLNISAPVLNVNAHLRARLMENIECKFQEDDEIIMDLAPTNGFDGFLDRSEWFVSARTIEMCIELVNSEYNHPFSAMQVVQDRCHYVNVYLERDRKFKGWERTLSDTILCNLKRWASTNMEWKIIIVDECHPCEYTGVLSYYQNYSI